MQRTHAVTNQLFVRRSLPLMRVSTGICVSQFAVVLSLSKGDLASAADPTVRAAILSRVPTCARSVEQVHRLQTALKPPAGERTDKEVDAIMHLLKGQPLLAHLQGVEAVKTLCQNMRLIPHEARRTIVWHEGSAASDNRGELHLLLDGKIDVFSKGAGVDAIELRGIKWETGVVPTSIVGKLKYTLTNGDVFGGPAVSGKSGPSPGPATTICVDLYLALTQVAKEQCTPRSRHLRS